MKPAESFQTTFGLISPAYLDLVWNLHEKGEQGIGINFLIHFAIYNSMILNIFH